MTDRYAAFIVVLDRDLRSDDAEGIRTALGLIRHVVSVEPVVADSTLFIARAQARAELEQKLWDALRKTNPL